MVQIRVKYLPFCIIRSLWSGFKMQTQGNRHIFDSLHMAKKSNIYRSSRKVNKRVDDYFVQRPKTHGLSRREIGSAY